MLFDTRVTQLTKNVYFFSKLTCTFGFNIANANDSYVDTYMIRRKF